VAGSSCCVEGVHNSLEGGRRLFPQWMMVVVVLVALVGVNRGGGVTVGSYFRGIW